MNNVNTSIGNTSVGEKEYTLYGKPTITEILRGLTFQISANSFFQTNTQQVCFATEVLFTTSPCLLSYYFTSNSWLSFPVCGYSMTKINFTV
jgi:hypothetical protein